MFGHDAPPESGVAGPKLKANGPAEDNAMLGGSRSETDSMNVSVAQPPMPAIPPRAHRIVIFDLARAPENCAPFAHSIAAWNDDTGIVAGVIPTVKWTEAIMIASAMAALIGVPLFDASLIARVPEGRA